MPVSAFRIALLVMMLAVTATAVVSAQSKGQRITPNFRDVEIGQVIEAVAQVTGKTIIPDPRVRANVTMLSQTAMSPEAFYQAFLALLQVHTFVAVESGGIIRVAMKNHGCHPFERQRVPSCGTPRRRGRGGELNAAQLVPVLRPLMPKWLTCRPTRPATSSSCPTAPATSLAGCASSSASTSRVTTKSTSSACRMRRPAKSSAW
jgi:general secretion pathway protein D